MRWLAARAQARPCARKNNKKHRKARYLAGLCGLFMLKPLENPGRVSADSRNYREKICTFAKYILSSTLSIHAKPLPRAAYGFQRCPHHLRRHKNNVRAQHSAIRPGIAAKVLTLLPPQKWHDSCCVPWHRFPGIFCPQLPRRCESKKPTLGASWRCKPLRRCL